jgi:sedoheptulose-bisphosphatase
MFLGYALLTPFFLIDREIGTMMRNGEFSHEEVGTTNSSGDDQLHVDLSTEQIIFQQLRSSGVCIVASSEETTEEVDCGATEGYSVAFDPLDGSSIVDANFAVGTICGVWPGRGLLNRTGREQSASLIAQYGPRLTVMLALNSISTQSNSKVCMELTMVPSHWIVTKHHVEIRPQAKTFAPGNLRATSDNLEYKALVDYWLSHRYTLRYSGGLVPDIYHILTKGEGVFSNAASKSAKAKLRLLYECAPVGLIVEAAGGMTTVAPCEAGQEQVTMSILDVPIGYLDKRVGICVGSAEEVERFKTHIFG